MTFNVITHTSCPVTNMNCVFRVYTHSDSNIHPSGLMPLFAALCQTGRLDLLPSESREETLQTLTRFAWLKVANMVSWSSLLQSDDLGLLTNMSQNVVRVLRDYDVGIGPQPWLEPDNLMNELHERASHIYKFVKGLLCFEVAFGIAGAPQVRSF